MYEQPIGSVAPLEPLNRGRRYASIETLTRDSVQSVTLEANTDQSTLDTLVRGALYRFADWPNVAVPAVAAGVYTI